MPEVTTNTRPAQTSTAQPDTAQPSAAQQDTAQLSAAQPSAARPHTLKVVAPIVVLGLFFLLLLYVGLSRHYNAQELASLVEGAEAQGRDYSVVIHNSLTGRYSFTTS